jgi:hypothetical protein
MRIDTGPPRRPKDVEPAGANRGFLKGRRQLAAKHENPESSLRRQVRTCPIGLVCVEKALPLRDWIWLRARLAKGGRRTGYDNQQRNSVSRYDC